jgi:mannose-1-phosphate guanylyltransferase
MTSKENVTAGQFYAVILAGGMGTRLWPRSRRDRPKQFLDIASDRTMLQETVRRIEELIPPERTFVVSNAAFAPLIREQLPLVPAQNILIEPAGRGTAPCIGLSALYLRRLDAQCVMASLNSDHVIRDAAGFRQALRAAYQMACQGYLVTLGIQPDSPHTGYGYIQQGQPVATWSESFQAASPDGRGEFTVYRVKRFKEKPDLETARQFVASGDHLWNSGIFIWKVSTLMEAMQRHMPVLYGQLQTIDCVLGTPQEGAVMAEVWQGVQNISVDVGVLEKADNVVVIPLQVGWNDVGSWAQLSEILPPNEDGNIVLGADHLGIDTTGSLIYGRGDRLIATIGLEEMVIVDTGDVLMVCPKSRSQDVKLIIDALQRQQKDKYL